MKGLSILVLAVVLFVPKASVALDEGNNYQAVVDACGDRIEAWEAAAANSTDAPSSSDENSSWNSIRGGIFIRGNWKAASGRKSVRASFLQRDSGKFDLFLSRNWGGVGPIQNISSSIFFRGSKNGRTRSGPLLDAFGVYNDVSGEICVVGCVKVPPTIPTAKVVPNDTVSQNSSDWNSSFFRPYSDYEQDCATRGLFNLSGLLSKNAKISATGYLESLRNESDSRHFTPIIMSGNMVDNKNQQSLYRMETLVEGFLYGVEAVLTLFQVVCTIKGPEGFFISMLMILVQVVVEGFLSVRLMYLPLRLLSFRKFKYLYTAWFFLPWLLMIINIALNVVFFASVYRKRRIAKRSNVEGAPQELPLACVCMAIYLLTGTLLWSFQNFETFLKVVFCWFLLPQVVANVFWDLRHKPLHPVYVVGLSLCRISSVAYDSLRPTIYGYDDLEDFPHSWFWSITLSVLMLMAYELLQQYHGGRCFLPRTWFGYRPLASSNNQAELSISKSGDDSIELGEF